MPTTSEERRWAPAAPAAIRFVASVAVVSGALLIADVAATLIWQEPVSALIAHRAQARLRVELAQAARLSAADARALRGLRLSRRAELARLAARVSARVRRAGVCGGRGVSGDRGPAAT